MIRNIMLATMATTFLASAAHADITQITKQYNPTSEQWRINFYYHTSTEPLSYTGESQQSFAATLDHAVQAAGGRSVVLTDWQGDITSVAEPDDGTIDNNGLYTFTLSNGNTHTVRIDVAEGYLGEPALASEVEQAAEDLAETAAGRAVASLSRPSAPDGYTSPEYGATGLAYRGAVVNSLTPAGDTHLWADRSDGGNRLRFSSSQRAAYDRLTTDEQRHNYIADNFADYAVTTTASIYGVRVVYNSNRQEVAIDRSYGLPDILENAFSHGWDEGYITGFEDGFEMGFEQGYTRGYADAVADITN